RDRDHSAGPCHLRRGGELDRCRRGGAGEGGNEDGEQGTEHRGGLGGGVAAERAGFTPAPAWAASRRGREAQGVACVGWTLIPSHYFSRNAYRKPSSQPTTRWPSAATGVAWQVPPNWKVQRGLPSGSVSSTLPWTVARQR